MRNKDRILVNMVPNPKTGGFTISMSRKNCTECGSDDMNSADKKLALHYLKDFPARQARLLELVEAIGPSNFWVCNSCKAFGAMPLGF